MVLFLLLFIHPLTKCVVIRKTKNLPGKVDRRRKNCSIYSSTCRRRSEWNKRSLWIQANGEPFWQCVRYSFMSRFRIGDLNCVKYCTISIAARWKAEKSSKKVDIKKCKRKEMGLEEKMNENNFFTPIINWKVEAICYFLLKFDFPNRIIYVLFTLWKLY